MPDKAAEVSDLIATLTRAVTSEATGENTEWTAFLARWHELHSSYRVTSRDLHHSAPTDNPHNQPADPWNGTFPTDPYGRIPSAKSIGRNLTAHINRWHGDYVLRSAKDPHMNARTYWVERATA